MLGIKLRVLHMIRSTHHSTTSPDPKEKLGYKITFYIVGMRMNNFLFVIYEKKMYEFIVPKFTRLT
jgi:hypothetical protein